MTLSRRGRREWRIFFWVMVVAAAISAWFGYRVAPESGNPEVRSALNGVLTSLVVATPILLFQLKGERAGRLRRLRRLPLAIYFTLKALFYFVVIVGGLMVSRYFFWSDDVGFFEFDVVLRRSIVFSIVMAVGGSLVGEVGSLLGFGTLKNLLTGHYVQPKREQRAFLLIDMKDSTGMAERLGAVRFHELLNDFFRDVTDAALECEAEIHKYVGDEAILAWRDGEAIGDGGCLACPFMAADIIAGNQVRYVARFGAVPQFRAALHFGEIVAGEIGDVRREIAYVGDTLNVAARLLEAAKSLGHDVLVSNEMLAKAALPAGLKAEKLPTLSVRGRAQPLGVAALARA